MKMLLKRLLSLGRVYKRKYMYKLILGNRMLALKMRYKEQSGEYLVYVLVPVDDI